ncbi:alpha/beta fold hydrolase [Streptomyces sp. LX-29]|uniref:thioesterase II family protein n=1 Tax=Streptomyces sp. LX-29 TaxID=2900152 RepID=UPI00240E3F4E|nr:alpha/beta fold hydrolase [Streptomyces sp. LX-29]WFB10995.1 alpha/beta fold hydrolase [Streptomyces sp. LX-29]
MTGKTSQSGAWLRRFRPAPDATVRVVCLPHAGGSASAFFPLSRHLPPSVDLLAVQYPGRQERHQEKALTDLGALADEVAAALTPMTDLPLLLFGHSMGAVVGFETAARLESGGANPPLGIIVSGRRSPTIHRHETVHLLDDAGLLKEIQALSGTQARILDDPDMVRMIVKPLRADYTAIETYSHSSGVRLRCPVSAFVGDCDPRVTPAEAEAWRGLTSGPFWLRTFSGGHFYLNGAEREVAAAMVEDLRTLSEGAFEVAG